MTNDATRASAEAMPGPQTWNGKAPSLAFLIATYWLQYDALEEAARVTDATESDTAEREAADEAQSKVLGRFNEAELAVLSFVPRRKIDARIKTNFVTMVAEDNLGTLHADGVAALLSSLPTLVAWDRKGGEA